MVLRVAAGTSVTERNVQKPIRTEPYLTAFVIRERLVLREEYAFAVRVRNVRIAGQAVLGDHRVPGMVVVMDEKSAVCFEVRMKRKPEQPALTAVLDNSRRDIQE